MSKQEQLTKGSGDLSNQSHTFIDALCTLILLGVTAVMCCGVWGAWNLKTLIEPIETMQMQTFAFICYAILMQMLSMIIWDEVFTWVFARYQLLVFSVVFFLLFMVLGIVAFILFLNASISFCSEEFNSVRLAAPLMGVLLFGSFFYKLTSMA